MNEAPFDVVRMAPHAIAKMSTGAAKLLAPLLAAASLERQPARGTSITMPMNAPTQALREKVRSSATPRSAATHGFQRRKGRIAGAMVSMPAMTRKAPNSFGE